MEYSYEATVSVSGYQMFEPEFVRYMTGLGFEHTHAGGWAAGGASHKFIRDDDVVSLTTLSESQTRLGLTIRSETNPVVPLVEDVLTEAVTEFLGPFFKSLSPGPAHEILEELIRDLRDSFEEMTDEEN